MDTKTEAERIFKRINDSYMVFNKNAKLKICSFVQQGDVLIKKVSEVKGKKLSHLNLATGEVTGHKHQITEGVAELYENDGTLFLKVLSDTATVTHEEHLPVTLPQGDYKIGIVREYDHFSEESKSVRD